MSDMKFNCPHCDQHLDVPRELLGQPVECPTCKGQMKLPEPTPAHNSHVAPPPLPAAPSGVPIQAPPLPKFDTPIFEALCQCGTRIPCDGSTASISCPECRATIGVRYLAHCNPKRKPVEDAGWEFVKGVFDFGHNLTWNEFGITKRLKQRFEEFQKFATLVYTDHLSPTARTSEANKRMHFVYFYENHVRIEHGPYDITTQHGFAEYLFHCITIQTSDFAFTPMTVPTDTSTGWRNDYDCPAVYEISINDVHAYYALHFVVRLSATDKGKVTFIRPSDICFEFFLRMDVGLTGEKIDYWLLLDGQLVPVSPSAEHGYSMYPHTLASIREAIGEDAVSRLQPLLVAKRKFVGANGVPSIRKMELELELEAVELSNCSARVFEIVQKELEAVQNWQPCFVVTACVGNENHPYVRILRQYRDEVLRKRAFGNYLISLYAQVGPVVARFIGGKDSLRTVVTFLIIRPAVTLASLFLVLHRSHRAIKPNKSMHGTSLERRP